MSSGLSVGALTSTRDVVTFVAFVAIAWFNGIELLWTIFASFTRWEGRYFYCLIVASIGVLMYETNIFFLIFQPNFNAYAVNTFIGLGWASMVTGQSLVLWSRLHLICRSPLKLRLILYMIIIDALLLHGVQVPFSLVAIKNNAIDPNYKPFDIYEKICVTTFTLQEAIISGVYVWESIRILRVGEMVNKKNNKHRIEWLLFANFIIILLDISIITMEFAGPWGVWCSWKGTGYSIKLKIEFAILNQLRESVKGNAASGMYGKGISSSGNNNISLSDRMHSKKMRESTKPSGSVLERQTFEELSDDHITKTVEISVQHTHPSDTDSAKSNMPDGRTGVVRLNRLHAKSDVPSESSSEIEFATRGTY